MGDLLELHSAAREGRLEDLKRLLSKGGVDLESADESGETPLYSASAAGHVDVVRVLVNAGAKFTGAESGTFGFDWRYNPLLNVACERGHTAVVKVLLEKGAFLNVASEMGFGPLHAACASTDAGVDMVRLLLEHGANPDEGDEDGWTAIMYAMPSTSGSETYQRQLDKLKILIDSGADVNKPENHYWGGYTPLHKAVSSSLADTTKLLLEHGADVHALNKRREVPLQVQYYLPPPDIILLLLDYDGGSAPCRKKKCGCGLTVDLCCYNHGLRLNSGAGFAGLFGLNFQLNVDFFEIYWTRMNAAGLMPLEDSEEGVVGTCPFWEECKEELARMKTEKVGDTNVAYINIWNQRPAALRQVEDFPPEVTLKFPIYENLIRRRYIMGRRKLPLMDKAQTFFSLLPSPKLLSECIDIILDFLSDEDDLKSLADIVAASKKINKSKRPNEVDEPLPATKVLKAD